MSAKEWEEKAAFWDALMGDEGNLFHRSLVAPSVNTLLNPQAGQQILDIACGNGTYARELARKGLDVVAVDGSAQMIELAKKRGQENIRYGVVDATNEAALQALGQFDGVVCNMALMDIPDIGPIFRAMSGLLKPRAPFVFSLMHPCFNSPEMVMVMEQDDAAGFLREKLSLKISSYLHIEARLGAGAPNEPNPHYYYPRPLQSLLGMAFGAGLVMDGLLEPAFPESIEAKRLSWQHFSQIPPVLAARMRVVS